MLTEQKIGALASAVLTLSVLTIGTAVVSPSTARAGHVPYVSPVHATTFVSYCSPSVGCSGEGPWND